MSKIWEHESDGVIITFYHLASGLYRITVKISDNADEETKELFASGEAMGFLVDELTNAIRKDVKQYIQEVVEKILYGTGKSTALGALSQAIEDNFEIETIEEPKKPKSIKETDE